MKINSECTPKIKPKIQINQSFTAARAYTFQTQIHAKELLPTLPAYKI